MKPFTELRLMLLRRGYCPLPLVGKAPKISHWECIVPDEDMIHSWERDYPHLTNTGIRATESPVIDIDILDADAVQVVLKALDQDQRLLYRTGRAPKVAILFRASEPFAKRVHKYRAPDGSIHKIEILCHGQQMAAYGTHPDTQKPFIWAPQGPLDVDWKDLPELTDKVALTFLRFCNKLLAEHGWEPLTREEPPSKYAQRPVTITSAHRQLEGIVRARSREPLRVTATMCCSGDRAASRNLPTRTSSHATTQSPSPCRRGGKRGCQTSKYAELSIAHSGIGK